MIQLATGRPVNDHSLCYKNRDSCDKPQGTNIEKSQQYWKPRLELAQPSSIWSALWYPTASLQDPGTFCFLIASSDAPTRLVDGTSGRVRFRMCQDRVIDNHIDDTHLPDQSILPDHRPQRTICSTLINGVQQYRVSVSLVLVVYYQHILIYRFASNQSLLRFRFGY